MTVNVWPAMLTVPDRGWLDGVSSAVNATVPGPVPLWPAVRCTQEIDEVAAQVHPGPVLTATEPGPPKYGRFWLAGLMLNVQPEPWLTVNVRPAIVSVALRAGPVVDATPNWTVPFPVPLLPLVTVIHGTLLAAVHPHSGTVATATVLEPPVLATEYESGLTLKVQPEL